MSDTFHKYRNINLSSGVWHVYLCFGSCSTYGNIQSNGSARGWKHSACQSHYKWPLIFICPWRFIERFRSNISLRVITKFSQLKFLFIICCVILESPLVLLWKRMREYGNCWQLVLDNITNSEFSLYSISSLKKILSYAKFNVTSNVFPNILKLVI